MLAAITALACAPWAAPAQARFEISFPASAHAGPITGRVFVAIAKTDRTEPIQQIGSYTGQTAFFGADIDRLAPGRAAAIDGGTLGYPADNLKSIPAGDYYVQALVNVYTAVPSVGRPHHLGPHGSMGWPAFQPRARQPVSARSRKSIWTRRRATTSSWKPAAFSAAVQVRRRYHVGEARQDREQAADGVLGPSVLYRRHRAVAEGL